MKRNKRQKHRKETKNEKLDFEGKYKGEFRKRNIKKGSK